MYKLIIWSCRKAITLYHATVVDRIVANKSWRAWSVKWMMVMVTSLSCTNFSKRECLAIILSETSSCHRMFRSEKTPIWSFYILRTMRKEGIEDKVSLKMNERVQVVDEVRSKYSTTFERQYNFISIKLYWFNNRQRHYVIYRFNTISSPKRIVEKIKCNIESWNIRYLLTTAHEDYRENNVKLLITRCVFITC